MGRKKGPKIKKIEISVPSAPLQPLQPSPPLPPSLPEPLQPTKVNAATAPEEALPPPLQLISISKVEDRADERTNNNGTKEGLEEQRVPLFLRVPHDFQRHHRHHDHDYFEPMEVDDDEPLVSLSPPASPDPEPADDNDGGADELVRKLKLGEAAKLQTSDPIQLPSDVMAELNYTSVPFGQSALMMLADGHGIGGDRSSQAFRCGLAAALASSSSVRAPGKENDPFNHKVNLVVIPKVDDLDTEEMLVDYSDGDDEKFELGNIADFTEGSVVDKRIHSFPVQLIIPGEITDARNVFNLGGTPTYCSLHEAIYGTKSPTPQLGDLDSQADLDSSAMSAKSTIAIFLADSREDLTTVASPPPPPATFLNKRTVRMEDAIKLLDRLIKETEGSNNPVVNVAKSEQEGQSAAKSGNKSEGGKNKKGKKPTAMALALMTCTHASSLKLMLDKLGSGGNSYGFHANDIRNKKVLNAPRCRTDGCKRNASYCCPVCEQIVYCSASHYKRSAQDHKVMCLGYRVVENNVFGKHTIAGRDFTSCGELIMNDQPLMILPCNPSQSSPTTFSKDYCMQCLTDHRLLKDDNAGTRLCPQGCGMWICKDQNICTHSLHNLEYTNRMPGGHFDNECRYLRKVIQSGFLKEHEMTMDHTVIPLLRFFKLESVLAKLDLMINSHAIVKMFNAVKDGERTSNFQRKICLLRNGFGVTEATATDEEIQKIDLVLKKFSRNCGPETMMTFDMGGIYGTTGGVSKRIKCVYPKIGYIAHSCFPNAVILINSNYTAVVHALRGIKKGEPLTTCYDDICLFWPIWKRREYLLEEFNFVCKCKRCTSMTECDTYFSGFPCSSCHPDRKASKKITSFILPESTKQWSDWACIVCKTKRVSHMRALYTANCLETELNTYVEANEPFGLLRLMNELVDDNYLHWNHYLIFEFSVKLLDNVWRLMMKNNSNVIAAFREAKGLQFLQVANVVLNLTNMFFPHGYLNSHVLPIRLAAVIKLRELIGQFDNGSTSLRKIDPVIKEIYFRSRSENLGRPLYDRIIDGSQIAMRIVEATMLAELAQVVRAKCSEGTYSSVVQKEAPYLAEVFKYHDLLDTGNSSLCGTIRNKEPIFPWTLFQVD